MVVPGDEEQAVSEGGPTICYGEDGAEFLRQCPKCQRFVKADAQAMFDGAGQPVGENATCAECGRVKMPWMGYV